MKCEPTEFGLLAEFKSAHELAHATRRAREAGYSRIEAYSPYPSDELEEAMALKRSPVPLLVLGGGLAGLIGGFLLQYWASVIEYPMNVGGRPLNSWPAFIPVTFETTVLLAVLTAVGSVLLLSLLPHPYHPVFNVPEFVRASQDRFFLAVDARDPKYDPDMTRRFMSTLQASEVYNVPR